jgi:hypothetical protein
MRSDQDLRDGRSTILDANGRVPERQGWVELAEGNFLVPWLLHIPQWEVAHREQASTIEH